MKTDRVGAVLSSACAVHCIVMPLVLTSLPLIGLGFLAEHWFETVVLIFAIGLACVSAVRGHKKHGKWRVTVTFSAAVLVMGIAHLFHDHHDCDEHVWNQFMMPLGGILAAVGHVWNLHHLKEAHCPCDGHSESKQEAVQSPEVAVEGSDGEESVVGEENAGKG